MRTILFWFQLDKGCAEIEITKKELYFLYPSINAVSTTMGLFHTLQKSWILIG